MGDFKVLIQCWYLQNYRKLPWRADKNPYKIWISEVIMQQTRVDQGKKYYLKFVEHYPTIEDLNAAQEEDVLHLWQGLGYYSRARNMKKAAAQVVDDYGGVFPNNKKELLKLKGVGAYTSAAIASIAFDEPKAVVDGNVYRVLSRVFEVAQPIDTTQGQKHFAALADELIDTKNPGIYNQAIMELGALVCLPRNPKCDQCPVLDLCLAGKKQTWAQFPAKEKKTKVKKRYLHYFLICDEDSIVIRKREANDIWKNLHDFPLIEKEDDSLQENDLKENEHTKELDIDSVKFIVSTTHRLTHRWLHLHFYMVQSKNLRSLEWPYSLIKMEQVLAKPFPVVIQKLISNGTLLQ